MTDPEFLDAYILSGRRLCFYIGVDPTARSLHLGHLLWIAFVKRLQRHGCSPIIIAGGATGKIGDPTWKSTERVMLDVDTIQENVACIGKSLQRLIDFEGENRAVLLNNDAWISELKFLDFLKDYGRHFSVNKMLTMDSVSERLNKHDHLSFLEFSYSLLQSYDFWHLFQNYDCVLQIGGQDQWSNIISGVDLIRRLTAQQAAGWTFPLLVTSTGKKMGKTEQGTVWLDAELTSPFEFWQYWRNVDDADVIKLLKLFTDIPLLEIENMQNWLETSKINDAKIILADRVTAMVHSSDVLDSIHKTADSLFKNSAYVQLSKEQLSCDDIKAFVFDSGITLDHVVFEAQMAKSLSEARRLIEAGAVRVDSETIRQAKYEIGKNCVISVGKKNFVKIETK
jgi:tyrosyl-tRNA synthetase